MRGRIGFFCEEKRCLPFHKEEGEKTRERDEKRRTPLALVLVYVVFVVLLNAPAPETTRAFSSSVAPVSLGVFLSFSSSSRLFVLRPSKSNTFDFLFAVPFPFSPAGFVVSVCSFLSLLFFFAGASLTEMNPSASGTLAGFFSDDGCCFLPLFSDDRFVGVALFASRSRVSSAHSELFQVFVELVDFSGAFVRGVVAFVFFLERRDFVLQLLLFFGDLATASTAAATSAAAAVFFLIT